MNDSIFVQYQPNILLNIIMRSLRQALPWDQNYVDDSYLFDRDSICIHTLSPISFHTNLQPDYNKIKKSLPDPIWQIHVTWRNLWPRVSSIDARVIQRIENIWATSWASKHWLTVFVDRIYFVFLSIFFKCPAEVIFFMGM